MTARATLLLGLGLVLSPAACAYESMATAAGVSVPVLVGPVDQIGGGPSAGDDDGPRFDAKVDRSFTASSSQTTTGNVTVTTTTYRYLSTGSGVVDSKIHDASAGARDRVVRVDKLRVNAYSGFFYSAAWIGTRVRVKGHVGRKFHRAVAPAPAAIEPTPVPVAPAPVVPPPAPSSAPSAPVGEVADPFAAPAAEVVDPFASK
jgi:hypothetical protein